MCEALRRLFLAVAVLPSCSVSAAVVEPRTYAEQSEDPFKSSSPPPQAILDDVLIVPRDEPPSRRTCSNQVSRSGAAKSQPLALCCHISTEILRRLFQPMRDDLTRCSFARGSAVLKFTVEEDGSILEACVEHPPSWTSDTAQFVLHSMLNLRLPSSDYELCPVLRVVYPLTFEPE